MNKDSKSSNAAQIIDRGSARLALIATGVLGLGAFLVLPSIVLGLITDLGFSERQIGNISSWQLIGFASGSVLSIWLFRNLTWRNVARVGVIALFLADFLCIFINDYSMFLFARFFAGLAGGVCISLASYVLAQTTKTDRNFALFLTFQVSFAFIGSVGFPSIIDWQGVSGIFIVFCVLEVATILLFIGSIPTQRWVSSGAGQGNNKKRWILCGIISLGAVFFFTAIGSFWTYIATIGIDAGMTKQQTGNALSLGLIGGFIGSNIATAVNIRLGRIIPMLLAIAMQLLAVGILYLGFTHFMFAIAAAFFCFGWYLYIPYQLGLLAEIDHDGKPMMLVNAVAGLGLALGPAIAANILTDGFVKVYLICMLFLSLSIASNVSAILSSRKHFA